MNLGLLKEWLQDAQEQRYGIPAINVHNMETVEATLLAAKDLRSPIILALAHSHAGYTYKYAHISTIVTIVRHLMKLHNVDAVLHIDHGRTLDFIE